MEWRSEDVALSLRRNFRMIDGARAIHGRRACERSGIEVFKEGFEIDFVGGSS